MSKEYLDGDFLKKSENQKNPKDNKNKIIFILLAVIAILLAVITAGIIASKSSKDKRNEPTTKESTSVSETATQYTGDNANSVGGLNNSVNGITLPSEHTENSSEAIDADDESEDIYIENDHPLWTGPALPEIDIPTIDLPQIPEDDSSEDSMAEMETTSEKAMLLMPNVVEDTVAVAKRRLIAAGFDESRINIAGIGPNVKGQYPPSGQQYPSDIIISLYLGDAE